MSRITTMTVCLKRTAKRLLAANVGDNGAYDNVSEYVRDKERVEAEAFERLKAELTNAFAAPESSYVSLTAADITARNKA